MKDDTTIATAALLGGNPSYFDYGHPERAAARMYWTISDQLGTVYGYDRAECARRWLKLRHPEVKLPSR